MNIFKHLLIVALTFSLVTQSFAMEAIRSNYADRMGVYNASPADVRIPGYTGKLNDLFKKSPSTRTATKDEKRDVLKAVMGTALIHGDNMSLPAHCVDASNVSLFRHFEILRITQELSQALAMQTVVDSIDDALGTMDGFSGVGLLKTYGGIEISDLKEWFTAAYFDHVDGLLKDTAKHWKDPSSYQKHAPTAATSSVSHAASKQMTDNPFTVENGKIIYQDKELSLVALFANYGSAAYIQNFDKNLDREKAWLVQRLEKFIPNSSEMKQIAFDTLYEKFEAVFKEEHHKYMNPGGPSITNKTEKVPVQFRSQIAEDQKARAEFLRLRSANASLNHSPAPFAMSAHDDRFEEEKKQANIHQKNSSAINLHLPFTIDQAAKGLGVLHPDLTRFPQGGKQTIFDHFARSHAEVGNGPAAYMQLLVNDNPYSYKAQKQAFESFYSPQELDAALKASNISSSYGRMGPLGLYIQYILWARETKTRPTPGYLGFDAGFAYNISHEEGGISKTHDAEIERFKQQAESAFSAGYVSYAAIVKNEHPTTGGGQHFVCVFATKGTHNKIKDIYVFNPTVVAEESNAIDSSTYQSILMPLKGKTTGINIASGNAALHHAKGATPFYTGDLNSFYTGIQSETMACGISASLLARYFIALPADQIDTRAKVIAKLKEFQRTLGYNDSHLNARGLYDSTQIEPDVHQGDYFIPEQDFGADGRIPAQWVRYKQNPVIEAKDESRIKSLQTRAETDLCEEIKTEFEAICTRLNGKTIDALPSVLQEYIMDFPAPAPRRAAALNGKPAAPASSSDHRKPAASPLPPVAQAPLPHAPSQAVAVVDTITAKGQTVSIDTILSKLPDVTNVTKAELENQIYTSFRDLDGEDRKSLYLQALPLINAKLAEFGMAPVKQ